jgi:hypothetical protein
MYLFKESTLSRSTPAILCGCETRSLTFRRAQMDNVWAQATENVGTYEG